MSVNWIAVACADHVRLGRQGGFMQVCHGKAAPLRRVKTGDRVVYYAPSQTFQGKDRLQAFVAMGVVKAGESYQVDMGGGFCPFRRDVAWISGEVTSIHPLLDRMDFTAGQGNWGYSFRFGVFKISDHDMDLIAEAMGAGVMAA